jgi:hypothetical protein
MVQLSGARKLSDGEEGKPILCHSYLLQKFIARRLVDDTY